MLTNLQTALGSHALHTSCICIAWLRATPAARPGVLLGLGLVVKPSLLPAEPMKIDMPTPSASTLT